MNRELTGTLERLMEEMGHPENWEEALRRVERNGGAPGPDGMSAGALRGHLRKHGEMIRQRLLEGRYRPGPVRRKEIAKPDGGVRALGIPTVCANCTQEQRVFGLGRRHSSIPPVAGPKIPDTERPDLFRPTDANFGRRGLRHFFHPAGMD